MSYFRDPVFLKMNFINRYILLGLNELKNKNDLIEININNLGVLLVPYDDCNLKNYLNELTNYGFIQLLSRNKKYFIRVIPRYEKPIPQLRGYEVIKTSPDLAWEFTEKLDNSQARPRQYHVFYKDIIRLKTNKVTKDQVQMVFDVWVEATDKKRVKLTAVRQAEIKKVLREYDLEDALLACKGIAYSEYHNGNNANGEKYLELKNIFKNVEKFRDLAEEHDEEPFK